jgi:diaminopimelate epimerase
LDIFFTKMQGGGNDFVIIDNRAEMAALENGKEAARRLCHRKFGIGADGLILIENPGPTQPATHFRWRFFNADGSEAEMCGNGARCAARFANLSQIAPAQMRFETLAGIIEAEVFQASEQVRIRLSDPRNLKTDIDLPLERQTVTVHHIDTGVPHTVLFVPDIRHAPVVESGRAIRYHGTFQPKGTNVNFVQVLGPSEIAIRTYERGVEDETLACGTGATAGAIISAIKGLCKPPVRVLTQGGDVLIIDFMPRNDTVKDVFLTGPALVVFDGRITL